MLLKNLGRIVVTALLVLVAAVVIWNLWVYYQIAPRTRDGRVRADVVTVSADVAGHVVEIDVKDNQTVHKDDVLFKIDPARYQIALASAQASLAQAEATLAQAKRNSDRYNHLGNDSISVADRETAETTVKQDQASLQLAQSALDLAKLNLDRTVVKSPVNGRVTNFTLKPGDYVSAGTSVIAVVDSDSYYIDGYFEETKLGKIHIGDVAKVSPMGSNRVLMGHVTGIAAAIVDPDRTTSSDLLANVDPSFTWVRLAQRVPVRIELDQPESKLNLVAGQTVSVDIVGQH